MSRQTNKRRLFFILGGILVFIGFFTLPFGILCILFGFYCVFYGTRFKALPDQNSQRVSYSNPVPPAPGKGQTQKQSIPDIPASAPKQTPSASSVIPAYQKRIDQLVSLEDQADRQLASLSKYLNQLFPESIPTKTRYLNIISKAETITDVNLVKARKAVEMFGTSKVTKERIDILDGYVASSEKMIYEIDNIVTELMQAEQSQLLHDTQILDAAMDELKETVKYYTPAK